MSQPPNVQHFNYRGGLTIASALAEVVGGIAIPSLYIGLTLPRPLSTHPLHMQVIVFFAVFSLFFLLLPVRDGLAWLLRCVNEKFIIDGEEVKHYDKFGRLARTFNLSDIASVDFIKNTPGGRGRGATLMSQESRYMLKVGHDSIRVYERLSGCDRFIALVRRFTNKPIFGLDNVPAPGP